MKLTEAERNVLIYAKCYGVINVTDSTTRFKKAANKLLQSGHLSGKPSVAMLTESGRHALAEGEGK